jgi:hypothetical protein
MLKKKVSLARRYADSVSSHTYMYVYAYRRYVCIYIYYIAS